MSLINRIHFKYNNIIAYMLDKSKGYFLNSLFVTLAILITEPMTLIKCALYTYVYYRKNAITYNLNSWRIYQHKQPVLLIHGAAGSWNYMAKMATELSKTRPVYVINLGIGGVTEKKRTLIQDMITKIYNKHEQLVDIIAHSMGANSALAAMFTKNSTDIVNGRVSNISPFNMGLYIIHGHSVDETPKLYPCIGKIITLANPTNNTLVITNINIYNIIAQRDTLMWYKKSLLYQDNIKYIDTSHIGIVFDDRTVPMINNILDIK